MGSLYDKLRMIREGVLLEADDDEKYDLPEDEEQESGDAATGEQTSADDPDPEVSEDDVEEPATSEDLDDSETEDSDDADSNTDEEDEQGNNEDVSSGDTSGETETDKSKPGESIPLDATSRKLLVYRDFKKFRELRDSVSELIDEMSQIISLTDSERKVIDIAIRNGHDLESKLTDYIEYRYSQNSYEVNYKNFMNFILEKRLIEQLIDEVEKNKED